MIFSPKKDCAPLELDLKAFDKSLSHRGVMVAFLTLGCSEIENFLLSQDCLATLQIARTLGAEIEFKAPNHLKITPPSKLPYTANLQCLNSGTSMRLYAGLLSARKGEFLFDGDKSLRKRPMQRIKEPLELMGAQCSKSFAPFVLKGNAKLQGISYHSPIASAQVKSAFILASLQAQSESFYQENELSRNHTEQFLSFLGAKITCNQKIHIRPLNAPLPNFHLKIPNDPSSAIFFIIACLISSQRELKLCNVLLNPTRIYAIEVLKQMGAKITYEITQSDFEVVGNIMVFSSELQGVEISSHIASLIDEIPALCIAFACAKGKSKITGAKELRVKESDRINSIVKNLTKLGIAVREFPDGLEVVGGEFQEAILQSYGDHRIAMSFALVGIKRRVEVQGMNCVSVSFPNYVELLKHFVEVREWK